MGTRILAHTGQQYRRAVSTVARRARALPAMLALLLLALPVLCIVHCQVAMQPAHHSTPNPDNPTSFFLCELPLPTTAHEVNAPSFLPANPLIVVPLTALLTLVARLATTGLGLLPSAPHFPPTPPPR